MIVEYTGRQFAITQKYRLQAEAGLERIAIIVGPAASAHVILSVDKYRKIAEVTVKNGVGSQDMVAICESPDMTCALHDALAKIEQQAVRYRQKTTTTMRHPRPAPAKNAADFPDRELPSAVQPSL